MSKEGELRKRLEKLNELIESYRVREDYSSPYQTYLIEEGEITAELKGIQGGRAEVFEDIKTVRGCLIFKNVFCDNKDCLNNACPLHHSFKKKLKSLQKEQGK